MSDISPGRENVILVLPDGRRREVWVSVGVNTIRIPVFDRMKTPEERDRDWMEYGAMSPMLFGEVHLTDSGERDQGRRVFS